MKLISVPLIVVLSYLIGEIYKVIFKNKQDLYKLIPVLVSLMGGVIAIIIYITERSIIDVDNIYDALLIGIISGSSSTGANQIIKNLVDKKVVGDE